MVGSFWPDVIRGTTAVVALILILLAQRFWFASAWRLVRRVQQTALRRLLRAVWFAALLALTWPLLVWAFRLPRMGYPYALFGMYLVAAMFGWLGVRFVNGVERLWRWLRPDTPRPVAHQAANPGTAQQELLQNPARRRLFQSAAMAAGIAPFAVSLYGYSIGRLHYVIERVEVPIPNLPDALDGLRIAQLSDIHLGAFLTREQARRAVEMANELGAELAVVTGDFITLRSDSLEDCVDEMAALRAPLGVWACNGNHEIYARCEARAASLFRKAGVRLLRQENVQVIHNGQALNLIGVDYQRTRAIDGPRMVPLVGLEPLLRRNVPNILLSHNPNAFPRAAELGIELTLAGHTHGGQVQVEILDYHLTPARFMTEFVAGLYQRPLAVSGQTAAPAGGARPRAHLYVNRGIGTVGTPIRVGSPPEITLLTLRRA